MLAVLKIFLRRTNNAWLHFYPVIDWAMNPIPLFKVVKIMRISGRRQILEKNLAESEAQRCVGQYPNSKRSMVVYYRQDWEAILIFDNGQIKLLFLVLRAEITWYIVPSCKNKPFQTVATFSTKCLFLTVEMLARGSLNMECSKMSSLTVRTAINPIQSRWGRSGKRLKRKVAQLEIFCIVGTLWHKK